MKDFSRVSVNRLNRFSRKKSIICIGCGKRFFEMIDFYSKELFVNKIEIIADNNEHLWGKTITINGKSVVIQNPQNIEHANIKDDSIYLITSDRHKEIFQSIKEIIPDNGRIRVFLYPKAYFSFTDSLFIISRWLPIKRQIVFYAGKEPHENADEIVWYLQNEYKGKPYSIVYIDEEDDRKDGIHHISKFDIKKKTSLYRIIKFCLLYGRSRYICYENEPLEKKSPKQKLIYLNHGTIPIKNVSDVLRQPEEIDYATCPGTGCIKLYLEQYGIPQNKLVFLMPPRINRMWHKEGEIRKLVNAKDEKVILWLPTFRQLEGSERTDSLNNNPISLLNNYIDEISEQLVKNKLILAIKKHPREKEEITIPSDIRNIVIIKDDYIREKEIKLHDLLIDADALLTDYSGIAFEYMLLNKPIGYVLTDMKDYFRGFSVKNLEKYMPGTKIYNIEDFFNYFISIREGKDEFEEERIQLVEELFGCYAYQNGSKLFVNFLDFEIDLKEK